MKFFRQLFWGVLLFGVLAVALTASLRWFASSEESRADVAMMMAPPPAVPGQNGFAQLLLIDHEVAPGQLEAVMAEELARFEALERLNAGSRLAMARRSPDSGSEAGLVYRLLEDSGIPERPPVDLAAHACTMSGTGCLASVRADPESVRALLDLAGDRTGLARQALASDFLRSPYAPSYAAPLPSYQMLRLPLTNIALQAVDGRVPDAMSHACSLLADARRHGATSADLISQMIMTALANGAAGLLLDIRQAWPDATLPDDCAPALAPVRGEDYLVCEAMRGEFRTVSYLGHDLDASLATLWNPRDLFLRLTAFDADAFDAWTAPHFADTCRDHYRASVLAGSVPAPRASAPEISDPTCWGAVYSCIHSGIAMMDSRRYQERLLDNAAKLRLQLAALAVADGRLPRDQAATAAASPGYPLVAEGDALGIDLRQVPPGQGSRFSVSLR